jgi:hypothetical protein
MLQAHSLNLAPPLTLPEAKRRSISTWDTEKRKSKREVRKVDILAGWRRGRGKGEGGPDSETIPTKQ